MVSTVHFRPFPKVEYLHKDWRDKDARVQAVMKMLKFMEQIQILHQLSLWILASLLKYDNYKHHTCPVK